MTDKKKLDRMKKLADAMYTAAQYLTTDASGLHKAMDEYHRFIIYECNKQDPASEDLEQAANKYGKEETILPEGYNDGDIPDYEKWTADAFKAGAQWQKEQMMKGAIEGEVTGIGPLINGQVLDTQKQMRRLSSTYSFGNSPYCEMGDKVNVIIIK